MHRLLHVMITNMWPFYCHSYLALISLWYMIIGEWTFSLVVPMCPAGLTRSELHLLFEPLPSFWIKPLKQGSPSRFDKAPQIGNVTLIQGTLFRFRSSLPIEGDFSKRDQNCISVSGLICHVDSVHCVCGDRIHFQITFHLIIFNNSIILPVGKVTGETHWWITAQKLPYEQKTQW